MIHLDETDRALMGLLAENARMPVAILARRLGLARSTVQGRLERLETQGAIAGYTLRAGPQLRPLLRATALISIEPRATPTVVARLKSLPEVESAHTTSGRFDLIVQIAAPSTEALDATLDSIGATKGVRSSESLIHLSIKINRAL